MTRTAIALAALLAASPAQAQSYMDLSEVDRAVVLFTGSPLGTMGGAAQPADRRLRLMPCPADLALSWYGARRDTVEVRCPVAGGWKLYVPIVGGGTRDFAAAPVILRGDAVTISVRSDGFAVSQPGEALEAGAVGAWIKVRGASSASGRASGAASGQGAPVLRARCCARGWSAWICRDPAARCRKSLIVQAGCRSLVCNQLRSGEMPPIELGPQGSQAPRAVSAVEAKKISPKPVHSGPVANDTARSHASERSAVVRTALLDPGPQPVDTDRIAMIRKAIEQGHYPVLPAKVADAMIAAGMLLRSGK